MYELIGDNFGVQDTDLSRWMRKNGALKHPDRYDEWYIDLPSGRRAHVIDYDVAFPKSSSQGLLDTSPGYACRCGQPAAWERARYNGRYTSRDYWCDECEAIEDGTLRELAREWDGVLMRLEETA